MSKFAHHKYEYRNPFGSPSHHWSVRGPRGAVSFNVHITKGYSPSAGLDFHRAEPQGDNAPSHVNCPLIGGPCWHDGTSLYATETLWPRVEMYLKDGDHESVWRILESEYNDHDEFKPVQLAGKERGE